MEIKQKGVKDSQGISAPHMLRAITSSKYLDNPI